MKTIAALVSLLLVGGCAIQPKSSIAIVVVPESTRGVPPAEVAAARTAMESRMRASGQWVTHQVKDADYWQHVAYVPPATDRSRGDFVRLQLERNPMKTPIPAHETPLLRPRIDDNIAGNTPGS